MKAINKLPFIVLIMASLACENLDPELVPANNGPNVQSQPSLPFQASLELQRNTITPTDFVPEVLLNVSYTGHGDSNLMGPVIFEANHEETFPANTVDIYSIEIIKVQYGHFTITSQGTGDSVYGSYSGLDSHWTLSIQGGTGKYASARGNLNVSIFSDEPFSISSAQINGSVVTDGS